MNFNDLTVFRLATGAHDDPEKGVCAMEAVAWLEGLKHTDHPECTCPVIAAYVRSLNDSMPDHERQRLVAYLPRLVGTVSIEHEMERAEWLAWQAITVVTPNVLEQIGLLEHATKMRALPYHDWAAAYAAAYAAKAAAKAAAYAAKAAAYADAYAAKAAANAAAYAAKAAAYADAYAAKAAAYADAYAAKAAANAAANAAKAAANAAKAAAYADAYAAKAEDPWQPAFDMLDGVLAIGPQSPGFGPKAEARVEAYRELISA